MTKPIIFYDEHQTCSILEVLSERLPLKQLCFVLTCVDGPTVIQVDRLHERGPAVVLSYHPSIQTIELTLTAIFAYTVALTIDGTTYGGESISLCDDVDRVVEVLMEWNESAARAIQMCHHAVVLEAAALRGGIHIKDSDEAARVLEGERRQVKMDKIIRQANMMAKMGGRVEKPKC